MGSMGSQIEQSAEYLWSMSGVGRLAMDTVKMGNSSEWAMHLGPVV
jgi:hypothetical protein